MNFKPKASKDVLAKQPVEAIPSMKGQIGTAKKEKKAAAPKKKAKRTGGMQVY